MGDMGGFVLAAGMEGDAQTWSPRCAMGTGSPQVEHLTEGRIWDILPCAGPGRWSVCAMVCVV